MRIDTHPRIFNFLHRFHFVVARSQTHAVERERICGHAKGAKLAVEIGTFMGLTAAQIAARLDRASTLYCIDPYYDGDALFAIAKRHVARSHFKSKVNFLRATSAQVIDLVPDNVDFIFVDGDHSYDGLLSDWQFVKKKLRVGGIVAFHDTVRIDSRRYCEGAERCFDEVIKTDPQFELIETAMSTSICRRKSI